MAISAATISSLQSGDHAAFTAIFEQYWKLLFQAAFRRLNDEQLAQDIVQDVFIQVWDRRETLNLKSDSLEFYLLRAVRNKIINYYASSKVKESVLEKVMKRMEEMSQDTPDMQQYLELERFIDTEVESFPTTMRAIFLLRGEQFSIQQIASKLNLAEQTVKNNITEASRRLRGALSRKFSDDQLIILFLTTAELIIA